MKKNDVKFNSKFISYKIIAVCLKSCLRPINSFVFPPDLRWVYLFSGITDIEKEILLTEVKIPENEMSEYKIKVSDAKRLLNTLETHLESLKSQENMQPECLTTIQRLEIIIEKCKENISRFSFVPAEAETFWSGVLGFFYVASLVKAMVSSFCLLTTFRNLNNDYVSFQRACIVKDRTKELIYTVSLFGQICQIVGLILDVIDSSMQYSGNEEVAKLNITHNVSMYYSGNEEGEIVNVSHKLLAIGFFLVALGALLRVFDGVRTQCYRKKTTNRTECLETWFYNPALVISAPKIIHKLWMHNNVNPAFWEKVLDVVSIVSVAIGSFGPTITHCRQGTSKKIEPTQ